MSILKYEFYKVISKKMMWFIMIALFFLNAVLYINEQNKYKIPKTKELYSMETQYSKLPMDDAMTKVNKTQQELFALSMIAYNKSSQNMDELLIKEQLNPILKTFQPPISYDEFMKKYGDSYLINDSELLAEYTASIQLIKEQLQYIADYPNFISSMKQNADKMIKVSVFSNPHTFAYRNIVKTPKDFEHLKGIPLTLGNQNGIVTSTSFEITDFLILALIFLLCVYIFLQEKENGLMILIKTNKYGHLPVIISKLIVLISISGIFSIIFYGSNLILAYKIYGFGDISRYVQSMSAFRDCSILLTVKEYLILFGATKVLVVFVTSGVFAVFFTRMPDVKSIYVGLGIFLAISYVCHVFIHPASYINVLKYLNIFSFFNAFNLYANYTNINFIGYPVGRILASIIVALVVLIAATLFSIFSYIKRPSNFQGISNTILNKLSFRTIKLHENTNLFLHETYKVVVGNKVYFIILFALVIGYNSINLQPLLMDYDSSIYKGYIDKLEGKLSSRSTEFIENEQERFNNIPLEIQKLSDSLNKGYISEDDFTNGINSIMVFAKNQKAFERVKKQYEYLLELQKKQGITGSFICELSSDYIFNNKMRALINGLIYTILLLLCISSIFADDFQNGMFSILKCTRHGRLRMFAIKNLIGCIIAALLMIIIYMPYYFNLLTRYTIGDWFAPIQSVSIYKNFNIDISILGFIIVVNLLQLISAFAMTGFILFVSQIVKKQSISILVGTVILVFPFLISLTGVSNIDLFTINNSFTLFNSFTELKAVIHNIVYFLMLIGVSLVILFLSTYKFITANK